MIDRLLQPLRLLIPALVLVLGFSLDASSQEVKAVIRQALNNADTTTAITLLQKEINSDPTYHINYYRLGRIYYEQRKFKESSEQFEKTLKRKKKHFEALYFLGRSQLELGDLDAAQESMEKGRKKAKDTKDWFENGYGLVMLARKEYQEADRSFRIAIALGEAREEKKIKDLQNSPHSDEDRATLIASIKSSSSKRRALYRINLGDANYYSGVAPLAILEYEKALAVDSGSLEVYFHWADACLSMRDYSCALEKLQIVLTKDSTYAAAWREIGAIYFKAARSSRSRSERTARFKDAIGAYNKYLGQEDVQPDSAHVRVFFEMAMSYAEINGFENAVENFQKVLAIPYEIRDIYFHYGKALVGIKNYIEASDMLLRHIDWVARQDEKYKTNIREVELFRLLGDSYFYRKPRAYLSAIEYYKKSLEVDSTQTRLLQNIAVGYHSTKSYVEALEYYDKRIAIGVDSDRWSIYRNAGYCAMNIAGGDADDDEFDVDEEEDEEGEIVSEYSAAEADPNVNYFELSISYLEKFLEKSPEDKKVVQLIANTYLYQLSDCANGVTYFEKLLALDTDNCAANKAIGFAYFGGDICKTSYTKALGYLKRAYSCLSDGDGACSDSDVGLWIAQCYHLRAVDRTDKTAASSDYKNAYKWYGRVLKCEPSHADAKKGQDDTRFEFSG